MADSKPVDRPTKKGARDRGAAQFHFDDDRQWWVATYHGALVTMRLGENGFWLWGLDAPPAHMLDCWQIEADAHAGGIAEAHRYLFPEDFDPHSPWTAQGPGGTFYRRVGAVLVCVWYGQGDDGRGWRADVVNQLEEDESKRTTHACFELPDESEARAVAIIWALEAAEAMRAANTRSRAKRALTAALRGDDPREGQHPCG